MKTMLGFLCLHITNTEKKEVLSPSIGQELRDLEQARQEGLLSNEEYVTLRNRIVLRETKEY